MCRNITVLWLDYFSSASGDYVPVTADLTFSASLIRICRNVTSKDDTILEDDEDFTLTLTTTECGLNLTADKATVTIIDNDCKLRLLNYNSHCV